jgi:hypothetical protein
MTTRVDAKNLNPEQRKGKLISLITNWYSAYNKSGVDGHHVAPIQPTAPTTAPPSRRSERLKVKNDPVIGKGLPYKPATYGSPFSGQVFQNFNKF